MLVTVLGVSDQRHKRAADDRVPVALIHRIETRHIEEASLILEIEEHDAFTAGCWGETHADWVSDHDRFRSIGKSATFRRGDASLGLDPTPLERHQMLRDIQTKDRALVECLLDHVEIRDLVR